MISVESFIQREPLLFKATCSFVEYFATVPDPILFATKQTKTWNSRIAWVLLGSALFQDLSFVQIIKLLQNLYKAFPEEKLWTLPVPKKEEIDKVVAETLGKKKWILTESVAGIFWSVGLFTRKHNALKKWFNSKTPKEIWKDLGEIYFMGRGSMRPKVCAAFYRLSAPRPIGLALLTADGQTPQIPLTLGARRFLAILGPAKYESFSELKLTEKQRLFKKYAQKLSPQSLYKTAHAFQFFLEPGSKDYICQERTDSCKTCPLYIYCSYGVYRR